MDSNFGREIKAARARAGVTQIELAERTGVSLNTISNYERGTRRRTPPREWVEAAEQVLGADLLTAAGYTRPASDQQIRLEALIREFLDRATRIIGE